MGRCSVLRIGTAGDENEIMTARANAIRNIILLAPGKLRFQIQNLDFRFQNLDSGDGASSINLKSAI